MLRACRSAAHYRPRKTCGWLCGFQSGAISITRRGGRKRAVHVLRPGAAGPIPAPEPELDALNPNIDPSQVDSFDCGGAHLVLTLKRTFHTREQRRRSHAQSFAKTLPDCRSIKRSQAR